MSSAALRRHGPLGLALLLLAVLWIGPLPARAETSFAAHMVLHMGVVALAWQALWVALFVTLGARLFRRGVLQSGSPAFWRRRKGVAAA